jgi:hypothetical protein
MQPLKIRKQATIMTRRIDMSCPLRVVILSFSSMATGATWFVGSCFVAGNTAFHVEESFSCVTSTAGPTHPARL